MAIVADSPSTSSARNYDWLKASVLSWSHRKDLAPQVPDFVIMAEERMSADIEARGIDAVFQIETVTGEPSILLPPEVVTVRSIGVPKERPLDFLAPEAFNSRYGDGQSSTPRNYTIIGDLVFLGPIPDAEYDLQISARMTVPPLADASGGVNWLIARNPSLYLAATMVEAMVFVRDDDGLALWNGKYQTALAATNSTKATAGDLTVRTDSRTP